MTRPARSLCIALPSAALLVLASAQFDPPLRAGGEVSAPAVSFLSTESTIDEATLAHLTQQTRDGLFLLARWYIQGNPTPLPPSVACEFLHLQALQHQDPQLRDVALGAAGAWASINLNVYLRYGAADSLLSTGAPGAPPVGRRVKSVLQQADLLRLFVQSFQASGKEMFRQAALRTGDDLLAWGVGGKGIVAWRVNEPDTLIGPFLGPLESAPVASALLLGSAVLQKSDWATPQLRAFVSESGATSADGGVRSAARARALLARIEVARFLTRGGPSVPDEEKLTPPAATDTTTICWSALATVRLAAFTHNDSLATVALHSLAPLSLGTVPETRDIDRFAARAAAGMAMELIARPSVMAYVIGEADAKERDALADAALRAWRPGKLVQVQDDTAPGLLYPPADGSPAIAYVCSGELCAPPTDVAAEVGTLVRTFALPEGSPTSGPSGP